MQCHPYLVSFLFIPSLYPSFLIRNFFYFLVSLLFLCMHAYIKSSEFIGGKGPRPLKFFQTMVMLDYVYVQSFMITHTQCFMLMQPSKMFVGGRKWPQTINQMCSPPLPQSLMVAMVILNNPSNTYYSYYLTIV